MFNLFKSYSHWCCQVILADLEVGHAFLMDMTLTVTFPKTQMCQSVVFQ